LVSISISSRHTSCNRHSSTSSSVSISKMEKGHKRKSFIKSIYQAAKPLVPSHRGSSKVKPSPQPSHYCSSKGTSFHTEQHLATPSSSMPKALFSAKPTGLHGYNGDFHGPSDHRGDENVDMKAASYISYVRERFKHGKFDSDHMM